MITNRKIVLASAAFILILGIVTIASLITGAAQPSNPRQPLEPTQPERTILYAFPTFPQQTMLVDKTMFVTDVIVSDNPFVERCALFEIAANTAQLGDRTLNLKSCNGETTYISFEEPVKIVMSDGSAPTEVQFRDLEISHATVIGFLK